MSNIITPDFGRRTGTDTESFARAHQNEVLFQAIREAVVRKPMLNPASQMTVAKNLWGILKACREQNGIRTARILAAAGKARGTDSTKRLPHFALDPALASVEQERRAAALRKKAGKYLEIAEAAARLIGQNADHFLLDLFRDTEYADGSGEIVPPEFLADAIRMRDLLHRICAWIGTQVDLPRYWEVVNSGRVGWRPDGEPFEAAPFHLPNDLPARGFIYHSHCGWVPGIQIGRRYMIEEVDFSLYGTADDSPGGETVDRIEHWSGAMIPGTRLSGLTLFIEETLHLGLAPDRQRRWGPVFEKRLSARINVPSLERDDRHGEERRWDIKDTIYQRPIVTRKDEAGDRYDVGCLEFNHGLIKKVEKYFCREADTFGCFLYEPVDISSVFRNIMHSGYDHRFEIWSHMNDTGEFYIDNNVYYDEPYHFRQKKLPLSFSPPGSIAEAIEISCLYGETEDRFHKRLLDTVARQISGIITVYDEAARTRDRAFARLLDELG
jgi:hypothetical protein